MCYLNPMWCCTLILCLLEFETITTHDIKNLTAHMLSNCHQVLKKHGVSLYTTFVFCDPQTCQLSVVIYLHSQLADQDDYWGVHVA